MAATASKSTAQVRNDITTRCPNCGKVSTVRGVSWGDLEAAGIDLPEELPVVERLCANCSFRLTAEKKPMTEAQKQARKLYNQNRQARIKAALAMYNAAEDAEEAEDADDTEIEGDEDDEA